MPFEMAYSLSLLKSFGYSDEEVAHLSSIPVTLVYKDKFLCISYPGIKNGEEFVIEVKHAALEMAKKGILGKIAHANLTYQIQHAIVQVLEEVGKAEKNKSTPVIHTKEAPFNGENPQSLIHHGYNGPAHIGLHDQPYLNTSINPDNYHHDGKYYQIVKWIFGTLCIRRKSGKCSFRVYITNSVDIHVPAVEAILLEFGIKKSKNGYYYSGHFLMDWPLINKTIGAIIFAIGLEYVEAVCRAENVPEEK